MTKTRAFIFARGGSKGIIGKNLVNLNGQPLIAHSILIAKKINSIEKIYVSTDSDQIADVSIKYGVSIIKRPKKLATDDSPEWLSWQHAIKNSIDNDGDFKKFISLPTTAPLRIESDIKKCLDALKNKIDIVITATESKRSPWFNMTTIDSDGLTKLVIDNGSYVRRQDTPNCYDLSTVAYVSTPKFILSNNRIWEGNVATVLIPPERAIDIDNQLDLDFARFLSNRKNLQ